WADNRQMRTLPIIVSLAMAMGVGLTQSRARAQVPTPSTLAGPPVPFEDVGACPFEGCVYREWVANAPVAVRTGRSATDGVAFRLNPGDRVQAITGIVVTVTPGRVQFKTATDFPSSAGPVRVRPGETLYLLTYHGEGETVAWFKGRLYDWLDGSEFFNGRCDDRPDDCSRATFERPESEWWVRLRSVGGVMGWTRETEKFDNKDAFGW
ncbi:MAG: hypothetical protein AB7N65_26465, partial [Vicinamibacterales bacterium]